MFGKKQPEDLDNFDVSSLNWDDEHAAESVGVLYGSVRMKATKAIEWYMARKRGHKTCARALRAAAAIFAALGTAAPILSLLCAEIPSELGYIFFMVGAACLLINRTLGISEGWIRYVTTSFLLGGELERFQLQWAISMAEIGGSPQNKQEVIALIRQLDEFSKKVNRLVEQETAQWAAQFEQDLSHLEDIVQRSNSSHRSGSYRAITLAEE